MPSHSAYSQRSKIRADTTLVREKAAAATEAAWVHALTIHMRLRQIMASDPCHPCSSALPDSRELSVGGSARCQWWLVQCLGFSGASPEVWPTSQRNERVPMWSLQGRTHNYSNPRALSTSRTTGSRSRNRSHALGGLLWPSQGAPTLRGWLHAVQLRPLSSLCFATGLTR